MGLYLFFFIFTDDPECQFIQDSDPEKSSDHRSQIMQFCGHEPICRKLNNIKALEKAKTNVEKHYSVVGITENINMTLAVLQVKMPEYFKDAAEFYHQDPEAKKRQVKTANKLPISEKVMKILTANLTQEIEFYEYCKKRLQRQFDEMLSENLLD